MDPASIIAAIASVVTIIAANFGFMKFLLKDIHKEQTKFNEEMRDRKLDIEKVNNRMDGLYRILLDKSYPKEDKK